MNVARRGSGSPRRAPWSTAYFDDPPLLPGLPLDDGGSEEEPPLAPDEPEPPPMPLDPFDPAPPDSLEGPPLVPAELPP